MSGPARRFALLLDLDGTLVDTIPLILDCFHHTFAAHGLTPPSDEAWTAGIGTPLRAQFGPYARDAAHLAELTATYRAHQMQVHDTLIREYEGIYDALAALRAGGRPIAIVTSKAHDLALRALAFARLTDFVDHVVGVEATKNHKPHPEPVHHALALLGRTTNDAIFIGDSPHDIASGRAAGVRTLGVTWGAFRRATLEDAGATLVIDRVDELVPAVESMENVGARVGSRRDIQG
jgi:pyrophosphatase PpaX